MRASLRTTRKTPSLPCVTNLVTCATTLLRQNQLLNMELELYATKGYHRVTIVTSDEASHQSVQEVAFKVITLPLESIDLHSFVAVRATCHKNDGTVLKDVVRRLMQGFNKSEERPAIFTQGQRLKVFMRCSHKPGGTLTIHVPTYAVGRVQGMLKNAGLKLRR